MAYQRKTEDWFTLEYNYGYGDGMEILCWCKTYREALADKKAYVENEHILPRIRKRRVKKEAAKTNLL